MAANDNRPVRILQTPVTGQVDIAANAGDGISMSETFGYRPEPVKSGRRPATRIQPPGAFRDLAGSAADAGDAYEFRHVVGTCPGVVIIDAPYQLDDRLESHRTARALLKALASAPDAPNAATPLQARALTAAVAAMLLAFLIGWAILGLPAPELAHLD